MNQDNETIINGLIEALEVQGEINSEIAKKFVALFALFLATAIAQAAVICYLIFK